MFLHCRRVALADLAGDKFVADAALPHDLVTALDNLVIFSVVYENERLASLVAQIFCKFLL